MRPARRIRSGPSSADLTLLRAALGEGDIARDAYARWRERIDWERLPIVWQRLLPLLHHNMFRLGVQDPLLERFRGVRRFFWARNLRLMNVAKRTHEALAAAEVPALALKGTSLVASRYVDRSIRPMEDVDVLVPGANAGAAIAVLEGLGFECGTPRPRCLRERVLQSRELPGCGFVDGNGSYVDLHWNALHLDRRPDADSDAWRRAREVVFEGVPLLVLDPADQLLQLCAHGLQDVDASAIRWIADAAIVIRGASSLDWQVFVESASQHRLSAAMADALRMLLRVISLPIPGEIVDRLRRQGSIGERIECRLRRRAARSARSRVARAVLAVAYFRRGQPELFDRPMADVIGPWLQTVAGTRTVRAALGRLIYWLLGHPRPLRRLLAPARSLVAPPASMLPTLGHGVDLTRDEPPEEVFFRGWSIAEPEGRWTDGRSATLAWRVPETTDAGICVRLLAMPALHPRHRRLEVCVFVGDALVGRQRYRLRRPSARHIACAIPRHLIGDEGELALVIEIRTPFVPLSIGLSTDQRALGIMLQGIEVVGLDESSPTA